MLRNSLIFFDSEGNNINARFDSTKNCWVSSIFFPKTSLGLISLKHIFSFSSARYLGREILNKPVSRFNSSYKFELLDLSDSDNEDFYFYDKMENNFVELKKDKILPFQKIDHNYDYDNNVINVISPLESPDILSFVYKPSGNYKNSAAVARISYYDPEIKQDVKLIEIYLYGECEKEDERFPIVMNNLGIDTNITDEIQVFKNVDPEEPLFDWNIVNKKRKELLLSYDQILPFTGTYKGIINAVRYYGYDNVVIKEWWENINPESEFFGKYKIIEINTPPPDSYWKKTGLLSLVYQLNRVIDELDEEGLPVVIEEFEFTQEEILQKLNLLKNKLSTNHIPIFSKIVDIVGETTNFSKLNLNIFESVTNVNFIKNRNINFDIDVDYNYINDLRELPGDTLDWKLMSDNISLENKKYYLGQLNNYNITDIERISDNENVLIGNYFNLKLRIFPKIGDLQSLKLLKVSNLTLEDCKFLFYSSVRWSVFNSDNERVFYIEGDVKEYSEVKVLLNKKDIYSVKVEVIDRYNQVFNRFKENLINLELKEVEFFGIINFSKDEVKIKDYRNIKLKSFKYTRLKNTVHLNDLLKLKDYKGSLKSLSKITYWKTEIPKPVIIGDLDIPISDLKNLKLKYFVDRVPTNPHFQINSIISNNDEYLEINGNRVYFNSLSSDTDYLGIANTFNNHFVDKEWVANPIEDRFGNYQALIIVNNIKKIIDINSIKFSPGVSLKPLPFKNNYYRKNGNFDIVITNIKDGDYLIDDVDGYKNLYELSQILGQNDLVLSYSSDIDINILFGINVEWSVDNQEGYIKNYENLDFEINNIKLSDVNLEIKRYNRVFFSLDMIRINGIKFVEWKIIKNSKIVKEIKDKNYFHYLFTDTGVYDVVLKITDNEGNVKEKYKNGFIIVN